MKVVIELPKANVLTSNQRLHWMVKARHTKAIRTHAKLAYKDKPGFERVHITVTTHWPDRRKRDAHNIQPTIKACIDGFVDAGLIPDDNDKYLVGPDIRAGEPNTKSMAVILVFEIEPTDG